MTKTIFSITESTSSIVLQTRPEKLNQILVHVSFLSLRPDYFWNYKQCKWITKSEHDQLLDDALENAFEFY